MTHTAKLVEARDRIKALAMKHRDAAQRAHDLDQPDQVRAREREAAGMDVAVRVIEDLLQD